jgi:hypothetical protein
MRTTIILVIAILVLLAVFKLWWRPRTKTQWVVAIVGGILGLALIFGISSYVSSRAKKAAEETNAKLAAVEKGKSAPPTTVIIQAPAWTNKTFEVPDGGLPVHLYPGWQTYPLGGAITITTPGGHILKDAPGVENDFGWQPEGDYIIRPDPLGSKRKVTIYNRW